MESKNAIIEKVSEDFSTGIIKESEGIYSEFVNPIGLDIEIGDEVDFLVITTPSGRRIYVIKSIISRRRRR